MKWTSAMVFFFVFLGLCAFVVFLILGGFGAGMLGPHEAIVPQRPATDFQSATAAIEADDKTRLDNLGFTLRLARAAKLGSEGKNAALSPYGVQTPLLMLLNGTQGKTFELISRLVGSKDPTAEKHNRAQSRLMTVLSSQPGAKVRIANALWSVQPVRFRKDFSDEMSKSYDAEVKKLGSAGSGALKQVNDWVKERTDGKIPRLFDRLDPQTVMIMVDVVSMDARWTTPFPPAREKTFHGPSSDRSVPTLSTKTQYRRAQIDGWSAGTLAYKDSSLDFTIVLPAKTQGPQDWSTTWASLEAGTLRRLLTEGKDVVGVWQMPVVDLTSEHDLVPVVTGMGGGALFRSRNDFSLVLHDSQFNFLSQFVQKIRIRVDERGTEAVAATGLAAPASLDSPEPTDFTADRPFAFFVTERKSRSVLFLGVVNDPDSRG